MVEKNELPEGWEVKKLGEVLNFAGGGTPDKSNKNYWNGNIPWASVKDVKEKYLTKTQDKISDEGLISSSAQVANPGEILLITRITPGKTSISKIKTAINQDLKIVKPKIEIETLFIYYFFQTIEKKIIKKSSGTTVLGIRLEILKDIEISLPPFLTQQSIVAKIEQLFSELDKGKEQLETAQQQLKVYRQAVLKWAFEGKLTNGIKDWNSINLKEAASKIVVGYVGPMTEHIVNSDGVILLSTTHIGENEFINHSMRQVSHVFNEKNKKSQVVPGDILIARHGDSGKSCIIPDFIRIAQVSNAVILRVNPKISIPKFICYRLNAERQRMQKMKVGGVFQVVNTKSMENFKIQMPPLPEQHRIVQEIESRLSVCDKIEETIVQALRQAESLRQSILKRAFEGKLL